MDFESYCISKKIDPLLFKQDTPQVYTELEILFEQMHPNSFTAQKLFIINNIRRQYKLTRVVQSSEPAKPVANKPIIKPIAKPIVTVVSPKTEEEEIKADISKKPIMKVVMKPKISLSDEEIEAQKSETDSPQAMIPVVMKLKTPNEEIEIDEIASSPVEEKPAAKKPMMKVVMKPKTTTTEIKTESTIEEIQSTVISESKTTTTELPQVAAVKKPLIKVVMKPKTTIQENSNEVKSETPVVDKPEQSEALIKKPMAKPIMKKRE